LAKQYDILPSDDIKPQRHIRELLAHDNALERVLDHHVGELIEGPHRADDLSPVAQNNH